MQEYLATLSILGKVDDSKILENGCLSIIIAKKHFLSLSSSPSFVICLINNLTFIVVPLHSLYYFSLKKEKANDVCIVIDYKV